MTTASEVYALLSVSELMGMSPYEATVAPAGKSGISFGNVQLDIGGNDYAQAAFKQILVEGMNHWHVSSAADAAGWQQYVSPQDYSRLMGYIGVRRPDKAGYTTLDSDLQIITHTLQLPSARVIADQYSLLEAQKVATSVNKVLDAAVAIFGEDSIFSSINPDHIYAVAMLASLKNTKGNLINELEYFQSNFVGTVAGLADYYRGPAWPQIIAAGMSLDPDGPLSLIRPIDRCFPAHTRIQTSRTTSTAISALRVGDVVLAFDARADKGRGALVPRRVTRLYRNTTTEWIRLSWFDGTAQEVITTPGHHFLDQFGQFPTIEAMLRDGVATVVLASGELAEVTAERIVYSAATAHLYERAQCVGMMAGNAALQPLEMDAWQTYNFEVEDLHTYVAGGARDGLDGLRREAAPRRLAA